MQTTTAPSSALLADCYTHSKVPLSQLVQLTIMHHGIRFCVSYTIMSFDNAILKPHLLSNMNHVCGTIGKASRMT